MLSLPAPSSTAYAGGSKHNFTIFLKDKATNISEGVSRSIITPLNETSSIVNSISSSQILGNSTDKYGNKTVNDLSPIKIRLIVKNDGKNIKTEVASYNFPAPIISYIDINTEQTRAIAYGIALNKNAKATFLIDYYVKDKSEFKLPIVGCLKWGYRYEYREFGDGIEHAGLKFQEDKRGIFKDPEIGWIWNDNSDGRFEYSFNLNDKNNHNLNIGDRIYAKSYAWGDIEFEVNNETISANIFVEEKKGLESDKSNVEEIVNHNIISAFISRVKYHFDNKIKCDMGGETIEGGVDCRGLALISIREATGKGRGSILCDKFGDCNPSKDIPSTGADGIAKNYMPARLSRVKFNYTYESDPQPGGLTIYDWDSDGVYDHLAIIYDVDSLNNRTWIYSNAVCNAENHLKFVYESELKTVKNKIINNVELTELEKHNILTRIYLTNNTSGEKEVIIKYLIDNNLYIELIDFVNYTLGQNFQWQESILNI